MAAVSERSLTGLIVSASVENRFPGDDVRQVMRRFKTALLAATIGIGAAGIAFA
ncbi:MAG: hypothetical protein AB7W59_31495 [Acidimicrobiia bacterium]